jgi:hypothetical protein
MAAAAASAMHGPKHHPGQVAVAAAAQMQQTTNGLAMQASYTAPLAVAAAVAQWHVRPAGQQGLLFSDLIKLPTELAAGRSCHDCPSVFCLQHPFSSFGMMACFSMTICITSTIRTACFMSTVLPSPTPGCYR